MDTEKTLAYRRPSNGKEKLLGSAHRDAARLWHKLALPGFCTASDIDLVLTDRRTGRVIAVLDFKSPNSQNVTDDEKIVYDEYIYRGIPVYLAIGVWRAVAGEQPLAACLGEVIVKSYPTMREVFHGDDAGFINWELSIRRIHYNSRANHED